MMLRTWPASVAVTGASGFLGRAVCDALVRAGVRTHAVVRAPVDLPPAVQQHRVVGLDDGRGLARAFRDADAVVHLASRVHRLDDDADDPLMAYRQVNVEGTRTVLRAAREAGVRDLVFASSVKAVGESSGEGVWDESTPAAPVDPYGISKLEAERLLLDGDTGGTPRIRVLRFPLIYGPGVRANMLRLFGSVDRRVPVPIGSRPNRRSLLYVDNAVEAVRSALASDASAGQLFFVSDDEDVSTHELVESIAGALDVRPRVVRIPDGILRTGGRIGDLVACVVPFPLTSAAVQRLLGSLAVSPARIRATAGYMPPVRFAEGIGATARWYREHRR
jgi:nucleoside-diphosphate-sugar epimerase